MIVDYIYKGTIFREHIAVERLIEFQVLGEKMVPIIQFLA